MICATKTLEFFFFENLSIVVLLSFYFLDIFLIRLIKGTALKYFRNLAILNITILSRKKKENKATLFRFKPKIIYKTFQPYWDDQGNFCINMYQLSR